MKILLRRMVIQWVRVMRQWERMDPGRTNLREEKHLFHLDKRKRGKDKRIRQIYRLKMK